MYNEGETFRLKLPSRSRVSETRARRSPHELVRLPRWKNPPHRQSELTIHVHRVAPRAGAAYAGDCLSLLIFRRILSPESTRRRNGWQRLLFVCWNQRCVLVISTWKQNFLSPKSPKLVSRHFDWFWFESIKRVGVISRQSDVFLMLFV